MTLLPPGAKVHLAFGYRHAQGQASRCWSRACCGSLLGPLFVFRGRKANLIKIMFWDGTNSGVALLLLAEGIERLGQSVGRNPNSEIAPCGVFPYETTVT